MTKSEILGFPCRVLWILSLSLFLMPPFYLFIFSVTLSVQALTASHPDKEQSLPKQTLGLFSDDLVLPPNAARIVFKMQIWSCHFLLKIFQSLSISLQDKPLLFSRANIAFHDLAQSQFQLFHFLNPHSDFMLSRQIFFFLMLLSKSRFSTKLLNFLTLFSKPESPWWI